MSVFKCDIKYKKVKGNSLESTLNKLRAHKFIRGQKIADVAKFNSAQAELNSEASKLLGRPVILFRTLRTPQGLLWKANEADFKTIDNISPFNPPPINPDFKRDIKYFRGNVALMQQEQQELEEDLSDFQIGSQEQNIPEDIKETITAIEKVVDEALQQQPELFSTTEEQLEETKDLEQLPSETLSTKETLRQYEQELSQQLSRITEGVSEADSRPPGVSDSATTDSLSFESVYTDSQGRMGDSEFDTPRERVESDILQGDTGTAGMEGSLYQGQLPSILPGVQELFETNREKLIAKFPEITYEDFIALSEAERQNLLGCL